MATTTNAVTVPQIEALRAEARQAGDWLQALCCTIALDEHDGSGMADYCADRHEVDDLRRILAMSQEQAWTECARVIRAAQGEA